MSDKAGKWLEKAENDLNDAKYLIQDDRNNSAVVFLQQAVEKSLKSVMINRDQEIAYTHNLLELANKVNLPEHKTDYFAILNTLYTGARYPGADEEEIENITEIVENVEEVLKWTKKQLKK